MKNIIRGININIDKVNYSPVATFKQEDSGVLSLELFKNGVPFDITGQTVKLGAYRPNGTVVEQIDGFNINNNTLTINFKNNIFAIAGIVELDIELIDTAGEMTTSSFYIKVNKKVLGDNNINASNELDTITHIVNEFNDGAMKALDEWNNLKKIAIDENNAVNLQNQVNEFNSQLDTIVQYTINKLSSNLTYNGVNIVNDTNDIEKYRNEFTNLKNNGIDTLFINEMATMTDKTSNIINDSSYFPIIQDIINIAKEMGFKIIYKPMINISDGSWRGAITPSDINLFFSNLKAFLLKHAQICSNNNIHIFVIATEMRSISSDLYRDKWIDIITEIRKIYNGKISYAVNFHSYETDEISSFSFYDKLDIIGVNVWGEHTNEIEPSVEKLVKSWGVDKNNRGITSYLKSLKEKYNKDILITEVGCRSKQGANKNTGFYDDGAIPNNETEQDNFYKAFFKVFGNNDLTIGYGLWCRNVSYTNTYDFKNKLAETTVREVLSNE